ncbi:unnamed protein product [Musa acuminata subsp. burmannicoides]
MVMVRNKVPKRVDSGFKMTIKRKFNSKFKLSTTSSSLFSLSTASSSCPPLFLLSLVLFGSCRAYVLQAVDSRFLSPSPLSTAAPPPLFSPSLWSMPADMPRKLRLIPVRPGIGMVSGRDD